MPLSLVFCADSLDPTQPDPDFEDEVAAATRAGLSWSLIDHDALVEGEVRRALRRVKPPPGHALLYRGWMVTAETYATLSQALQARGHALLTSPAAYRTCHHLPAAYPLLAPHTAPSVWVPRGEGLLDAAVSAAASLSGAAIVKDYVKSLKHHWHEACFIPDVSDAAAVRQVVGRFLALRGEALEGGVVLRQALPLAWRGHHPDSGAPVADEHRRFYLRGELIAEGRYWADAGPPPPPALFSDVAARIPSPFFSMDLARLEGGGWVIIEVGDGQVSGLVPGISAEALHTGLRGG